MKRLLQAVLVLLLVSLALFVMLRIVPGNPVSSDTWAERSAGTSARAILLENLYRS